MIRTRQPSGGSAINWNHPLARNLVYLVYAANPAREVASNQRLVLSGQTLNQGAFGQQIALGAGAGSRIDTAVAIQPITGTVFTIAVLANPPSDTQVRTLYGQYDAGGGGPYVALVANCTAVNYPSATASAGRLALSARDSPTANVSGGNTGVGSITGGMSMYAASGVADGTTDVTLYVDGIPQALSPGTGKLTIPNSTLSNTSQHAALGNLGNWGGSGLFELGATVVMGAAWKRVLTAAEHMAFARNPWQILFQPPLPLRLVAQASIFQRRTLGQRVGSRQAA